MTECNKVFEKWWKDNENRIMQSLCVGDAALLFSTQAGREIVKSLIRIGFSAGAACVLNEANEIIMRLSGGIKTIQAQTRDDSIR